MNKPTQYELDVCCEVLEYMSAVTTALEPYAVTTIAAYDEARQNIPCEDELEDMPDGDIQ